MPHGLLKNLHRVELVVLVEIVRHPAGEPGLRPQQCRFFRKFFPDRTAIFRPFWPTFRALFLLWPTWLSYAVSYLFIAIVWVNHHHLLRYATEATPRLMWFNFAHLFSVSLLPLSTAWMAVSKLAPQPVAFYAAVFFFVNATYMGLIWELLERSPVKEVSPKKRRVMRFRSIATLSVFGLAAVVAFRYPLVGLGMCILCLIVYLKPEDIVP